MQEASLPRIVLASQSPRRRELAEAEGWQVEVVPPPESAEAEAAPRAASESLEAWVARLAKTKAEAVMASLTELSSAVVLACDTIGVVDGEPLGKPRDRQDAAAMLTRLSGRLHRVLTGSCLWPIGCPPRIAVTESILEMAPLSEAFLEQYLDSGLWRGKAGACGFQDGVIPLTLLAGSSSNVVGIPLESIRRQLEEIRTGIAPDPRPAFDWFPATRQNESA
jgi:septum formation protein